MEDRIQLAHGGGGRLSAELIEKEILSRFGDGPLEGLPDAAVLSFIEEKDSRKKSRKEIVFSTDSFVVKPLIFPGGNIGNLAVHGTVNDISVAGGRPLWLSLGLILEEGLPFDVFRIVLDSIKKSAEECNVKIVTGDTKVVAKGQCDGMYINTAGIGEALENFNLSKNRIVPGDALLVSGTIGDHGMAVLSAREGILEVRSEEGSSENVGSLNVGADPSARQFGNESCLCSDTASVHRLVEIAHDFADEIRFMRDPTRGGVATVLNEIAQNVGFVLESNKIPISPATSSISEILGIDILNVACEGRLLLVCSQKVADIILSRWKETPEGVNASIIGKATSEKGRVTIRTITGGTRLVDVPQGELLPRIC